MTDSMDPRTGPTPEAADETTTDTPEQRAATDPDAMTFFETEPSAGLATGGVGGAGLEGDATGGEPGPNAGYIGGLDVGDAGSVGMRQVVTDEATQARHHGENVEPDANLGQQDR